MKLVIECVRVCVCVCAWCVLYVVWVYITNLLGPLGVLLAALVLETLLNHLMHPVLSHQRRRGRLQAVSQIACVNERGRRKKQKKKKNKPRMSTKLTEGQENVEKSARVCYKEIIN